MDRRELLLGSLAALPASRTLAAEAAQPLPRRDAVEVAFVVGPGANVIDVAGPWEVFQDVRCRENGTERTPFRLSIVGESREPVAFSGGLGVRPNFAFADAPAPNVIVVPAQTPSASGLAWIRANSPGADMTMSICTGAFVLGACGLLNGLSATTHHEYWDRFARAFPSVRLERGGRFVDNGRVATAAGLTSGIDLALHVVARYFGAATAQATTRYLEHVQTTFKA